MQRSPDRYRGTGFLRANQCLALVLMALSCLACQRKVNPPPSTFDPADPSLRARGEYLAQAGNCGACHKEANGHPMAGGQAFETPFGRVYAANITPDRE